MICTPIWKANADTLRHDIVNGYYKLGDKLPTEGVLMSARFGVTRHTLRHVLKNLADVSLVRALRDASVFIATTPTE